MKKNILFLSIILAGICLAACSKKQSEQERISEESRKVDSLLAMRPDWKNTARLKAILNDYYMQCTFKQNRMTCPQEDGKTKQTYQYTWTAMSEDSIFPISDFAAIWTLKAKTPQGDSLLVDYRFTWKRPSSISDTTKPDFTLADIMFRKINKDLRYYFVKKGKIWEKVMVKTPLAI